MATATTEWQRRAPGEYPTALLDGQLPRGEELPTLRVRRPTPARGSVVFHVKHRPRCSCEATVPTRACARVDVARVPARTWIVLRETVPPSPWRSAPPAVNGTPRAWSRTEARADRVATFQGVRRLTAHARAPRCSKPCAATSERSNPRLSTMHATKPAEGDGIGPSTRTGTRSRPSGFTSTNVSRETSPRPAANPPLRPR